MIFFLYATDVTVVTRVFMDVRPPPQTTGQSRDNRDAAATALMAREAGSENETPNPMETSRSRSIRLVWLDPIRNSRGKVVQLDSV